jgi:hypothetical protein
MSGGLYLPPSPRTGGSSLAGCPRLLILTYHLYLEAVFSICNPRAPHPLAKKTPNLSKCFSFDAIKIISKECRLCVQLSREMGKIYLISPVQKAHKVTLNELASVSCISNIKSYSTYFFQICHWSSSLHLLLGVFLSVSECSVLWQLSKVSRDWLGESPLQLGALELFSLLSSVEWSQNPTVLICSQYWGLFPCRMEFEAAPLLVV